MKNAPMRRLATTIVILCLCGELQAFEGRVVYQDGKAVKDATISVLGYRGSSRTSDDGVFIWTPDPSPPFEVLVVLPGGQYMAPVLVEELPSEGQVLITVEPLVAETVIVTAAATPNIEAPPASGMSTVPEESIEVRHPVRLTDAIQSVPGAGRVSDLHAAVPTLRGLARGRTLIMIDGARVTSERRAGASAMFLDPFFLEGVEISRGPGSVAYGSDAFGGIIHARTRHPEPGSGTRVRMRGSLGAGLPEKNFGVEVRQGLEEGGFVLQARYRDFDEYYSPEGRVTDSQASDRGFLGRFGHEIGRGMLSVGWQSDHGRNVGRPTTRSDLIGTSYPREDSERVTVSYDLDSMGGFTRLGLVGFMGSSRLITERDTHATQTSVRRVLSSDMDANDYSFRGLAVRPFKRGRLEFGIDLNGRFNLSALNTLDIYDVSGDEYQGFEEIAIESANRKDTAAYTSAEVLLASRITASGGLRFDYVTTRNEGGFFGEQSTANNAFSGFGAIKADLASGTTVTGQVSSGFRDPALSARYFVGASGRGFVTGNPELGPESALQYDVALRFMRGRLRWALYGYYYRISDLIERYEEGNDLFFFRNRGEARIQGLEFELQGNAGHGISYEVGAQVADGVTLDDDVALDDIPATNIQFQIRKELGTGSYARVQLGIYVEDNDPGPTEIVTPSFVTLDIGAGVKVAEPLKLRFLVRNLLDRTFPISPDRRAVLAPGINGVVTLVAEF